MAVDKQDHTWTDRPVCPHCGHVVRDDSEMFEDLEGFDDFDCPQCGLEYRCRRNVVFRYSTRVPEATDA
ncbi:hypothetical protein SAMN05660653_00167 [Desulfonatronum thiosulfatophilum]|uniref:Uncharacterized protein n=1 Tax=Desulfonatronum thiosulfatophilum TaxID=617002 RepID=A0A1G6A5V4_9BACT|nr:hypothetical protein [Desulfonatronum thiosulfatophilum]SDB03676.1 hypothetical protein SAMN05660653_00167 [Desulfonatronum thiosulfatophilum]